MTSNKERIALDMDEVVADLMGSWIAWCKVESGMDADEDIGEIQWDVSKSFPVLSQKEVYSYLSIPNAFLELPVIEGAIEGVKELSKYYDITFLTAARSKTAFFEKINWVGNHFGKEYKNKVIACSCGKMKSLISSSFDIMVDDNPEFIKNAVGECTTILFTADHNKDQDLGYINYRVDNWEELVKCLTERHLNRELERQETQR
jgi:5'-nucleotidase